MAGVGTGRGPLGFAVAFVVVTAAWGCSSEEGSGSDTAESGANGVGGTDSASGGATMGTGGADLGTGGLGTGGLDPGTGGAPPTPTSGCDAATWPENGRYSMDVDGTTREYVFTAPDGYDGTVPMKLIFVWHGLGGTIDTMDSQFWGYYGMGPVNDGSAILVAGQGLGTADDPTGYAWRNTDGEDIAFTRAMVDWFGSNFCIDADRIFSTGMSYGGVMSNEVGCQMGDVMRAIAPIAGAGPGFGNWGQEPSCVGPVATLLIHGTADETVTFDMGEASRDYWLGANGCGTTTAPVAPTEYCEAYDGCGAGTPVVFCVHDGGHTIPDFSAQTIWDFFQQS